MIVQPRHLSSLHMTSCFDRSFSDRMTRVTVSSHQVHMMVGDVLVVCVALAAAGSLRVVRVAAYSVDERSSGGSADAWGQSQHHVFQ